MSRVEAAFCRSAAWGAFARRTVLPWAIRDVEWPEGEFDVLEIGAGRGAMASAFLKQVPRARLTVTDLDPQMVEGARRRLDRDGHLSSGRAQVHVADVTQLQDPDHSYNAITSYLMLHHIVDWPHALDEIARVLAPGGLLVGYDLIDTALARLVHRLDGSPHELIEPDQLRQRLTVAGLDDVHVAIAARHLMKFTARKR